MVLPLSLRRSCSPVMPSPASVRRLP